MLPALNRMAGPALPTDPFAVIQSIARNSLTLTHSMTELPL